MVLHPMVVHFPIALLITAGGLYVFSLFKPDHPFAKTAFLLHLIGVGGTLLAILTGGQAESEITHTRTLHELVERHELIGWVSAWIYGILAGWHYLRNRYWKKMEQMIFVSTFVLMLGGIGYTSWLGGELVYKEGAGVTPMEVPLKKQFDLEQNER